jgi:hypothetical protein
MIKYSFISTKHKNSKIYGLTSYNTAILQTQVWIKLYIKGIIKAKFIYKLIYNTQQYYRKLVQ